MKKTLSILLLAAFAFATAYSEPRPPFPPSKKIRQEMLKRKELFINQVVNFNGNEEAQFLKAYKIYNRKKDNSRKASRNLMNKIEHGQSHDYDLYNDLKIRERNIEADAFNEYITTLRTFLSDEKIYRIQLAEEMFKKKLLDHIGNPNCPLPPPK